MKKAILMMISIGILLGFGSISAAAADEQTEYVEGNYTYTVENGKATITKCASNDEFLGEVVLPDTLGGYPVIAIGERAFASSYISSVTIPGNIETIGSRAFVSSGIKSVKMLDGVKTIGESAFRNCYYLEALEIPQTVSTIGQGAFAGCDNLIALEIPQTVSTIGQGAFASCDSLIAVEIPGTIETIEESVFGNCSKLKSVKISEGVKKIEGDAFEDCSSLETVEIPSTITEIGSESENGGEREAFGNCKNLKAVYISDMESWCRISFFGNSPLYYAGNLYLNGELVKDLVVPEDMTEIKSDTFRGGTCFESVKISPNIGSVEGGAFLGCENIKAVYISDLKAWCQIKFAMYAWQDEFDVSSNPLYAGNAALYLNGELIKNLIVPEGIGSIGNGGFAGCSSIQSVTIPEGLVKIGEMAFYQCDNLVQLTVPKSLKIICDYDTFSGSQKEKDVYISDLTAWSKIEIWNSSSGDDYSEDEWEYYHNWGKGYNLYLNGELVQELAVPIGVYNKINGRMFTNCKSLTNIIFPELPDGAWGLDVEGFWECSNLTDLEFPDHVHRIDGFMDCTSLTSVKFPHKREDGDISKSISGFNNCPNLNGVEIPDSVFFLSGFEGYKGAVKIPDSVTSIDSATFGANSKNKDVTILCSENSAAYIFAIKYDLHYKIFDKDVWVVTYKSNGGQKMPAMQVKEKGKPLTLTNDVPVKRGYTFNGWRINGDKTKVYQPGDTYTADANIELEATWKRTAATGDVDGNGSVNLSDVIQILNAVTKGTKLPVEVADVNGDGVVNMSDAIYLLNQVVKGK